MRWLPLVLLAAAAAADNRNQAIERGLRFIYKTACDPKNLKEFGEDYLWCFYSIGATSRDPALARMAFTMGRERAAVWQREHATLRAHATAAEIADLTFGAYAAEQLGFPGERLKQQIRRAAATHSVQEFLAFDPTREPPRADAATSRSRYDVWCDALIVTYTGDRYGVTLGAPYSTVIRWLPAMRPYEGHKGSANYDILYAVTHLVYTQNEYSKYRLSPRSLPDEFAYLKVNVPEAIARHDPETVGELLDSLKSFGLADTDPLIRTGTAYLLSTQNPDGSWGDMKSSDIYQRYHPTWTAIDGLRDYKWARPRD